MLHVQHSLLPVVTVKRSITVLKQNKCLFASWVTNGEEGSVLRHSEKQKYVAITCVILAPHFKQEIAFRSFSPDNLLLFTLLCS